MEIKPEDLSYLACALPDSVRAFHESGYFDREIAAIDRLLSKESTPGVLRKRLSLQRVLAEGMKREYPLDFAQALGRMREDIPDFSGEELSGILEDSVVENCVSDHVAIDTGRGKEIFAGGIAGRAAESLIADCEVNTGDNLSARIQGGGYVGGIVGFQNSTDIFNTHVMGTIGGSGSQSIGGITGKYASGKTH